MHWLSLYFTNNFTLEFVDRERWTAVDLQDQTIPTQYNAIGQNIAVSAPGRDTIYFSAPGKDLFS